ncbi:MAG: DUF5683 domain-containing protein [Daejeonella sp.]
MQSEVFSQDSDTISAPRTGGSRTTVNEVVKDSARLAAEERPRIAVRKSAILPGLGQIYNKRWWKVPLVYGGFIGIGLVFEFNQRYYQIFLKEAQYRELNPGKSQNPLFAQYSREGIISIKDSYRRNRDLSILAGIGFYAIQLIDAYVDAKFFRFDISDDLSLKIEPLIQSGTIYNASVSSPGIGFKVKLAL